MNKQRTFEPSRITKPIQLLAAWLSGLLLVNGSFLATAIQLTEPAWLRPLLVIASVLNIPIFLGAIFLLQTRFRPEMQEDIYYSEYLGKKLGNTPREITPQAIDSVRELTQKNFETLKGMIVNLEEQQKKALNAVSSSTEGERSRILKETLAVISKTSINPEETKEDISFADKTIAVNVSLNQFKEIAKAFHVHKIPIHEFFGKGGEKPNNFAIAFGDGFSKAEMLTILKATQNIDNPFICYANDEIEHAQYANRALVGAYAVTNSITATYLLEMLTTTGLDIKSIYEMIGKE